MWTKLRHTMSALWVSPWIGAMTTVASRESRGGIADCLSVLFWLNPDSKAAVDKLFTEWKAAQAKIVSEPTDKPWKLRELTAADPDGNLIRVFYDFRRDE